VLSNVHRLELCKSTALVELLSSAIAELPRLLTFFVGSDSGDWHWAFVQTIDARSERIVVASEYRYVRDVRLRQPVIRRS
jgi:hypothetical protein